ncbi:MAG: prenyltransferase/squalene oxidase repeat-containing protein [Nocardioides sp.]
MKLNLPARAKPIAAIAVGSLLTGGLVVASAAQAVTPPTAVNAPSAAGADWLDTQLTDGLIYNPSFGGFNDYGLSIDAGLALAAVGAREATLDQISAAVAANVDSYVTGVDFGSSDIYAAAVAKAAAFAGVAGGNPASFGGVNLISRLEARTSSVDGIKGRIEDASTAGDYANTIGQGFAVEALVRAGSPEAGVATRFLLKQQCAEGYFRLGFTPSKTAVDQTCDGGTADESAADTDVTALVLISLQRSGLTTPAVTAAMANATAWLLAAQADNGSWGGGPTTATPNTNSTGLAGFALGVAGESEAAARAAAYVRRRQAFSTASCSSALAGENGAIAYSRADFRAGRVDGITTEAADQWRRATAQALPVLRFAETNADLPAVDAPRFVRANRRASVTVTGLEVGERICIYNYPKDRGRSFVAGSATREVHVRAPGRTRRFRIGVFALDGGNTTVVRALAKKRLTITLGKPAVRKRRQQSVVATGFQPRERVRVRVHGDVVADGRAGRRGKFKAQFTVRGSRGPAKVVVRGRFPNREGVARFVVRSR